MAWIPRDYRNLTFISFSQFGTAFSFNFINIFLPFFIIKISPYSYTQTLLWIGAIIGSSSVFSAMTATFWGSLTNRYSPKLLYLRGMIAHAILFFLMGFTANLYLLLFLRILQGMIGGLSTIGLIIVSSSSKNERISTDIGIFQSSMTFGQLVGPPIGTLGVALLGYKGAFISASTFLFASFLFCCLYVTDVPQASREVGALRQKKLDRRILIGWMVILTVQIQIIFLPSVLPNVFEGFKIEHDAALRLAGIVVMLYTATAVVGTYAWSWLAKRTGVVRMISFLVAFGILLQFLLIFSSGVVDFTIIRMVQTGLVAATMPLVVSVFIRDSKGGIIGFLNSARFLGNAIGPVLATSLLAFFNLPILYGFIGGLTLVAFVGFKLIFKGEVSRTAGQSA
jgi:DHA1 family multidrug resistance protein-like MFS transporter